MNKVIKLTLLISYCFLAVNFGSNSYATSAKVTVLVVDSLVKPVQGAEITFGFTAAKDSGSGLKSIGVTGYSDKGGIFAAEHETAPYVTIHVEKEGYYFSEDRKEFKFGSNMNRWEPWNPTVEVVLKKKRNPVAMFAKNTDVIKIPIIGKPVGYDLEKGDWVAPHGKGVMSDFIFTLEADYQSYSHYDAELKLEFANDKDGIQEFYFDEKEQSYYRWPFEAPADGYHNGLSREKSDSPDKGMFKNTKENAHYFFRVRTKTDKDGNIIEAKYGKIPGEFGFDPTGNVRFAYYFNPDGTRNIEFDPEKNLFKWSRKQRKHQVRNP